MTDQEKLNSRVLKLTKALRKKYAELFRYIEEEGQRLPAELREHAMDKGRRSYYKSVDTLLSTCILEFSGNTRTKK